jgi:uncharacterized delta-60 repeat protein
LGLPRVEAGVKRFAPLAAVLALVPAAPAVSAAAPGSPDRSFGRGGTVTIADPLHELTPELVARRGGRILVGARAHVRGGTAGPGFSFFRLLPDGRPDRRFGSRGRVDADLPGASTGALLPGGGFAAARIREEVPLRGTLEVVRLTRSGDRDQAFGNGGMTTVGVDSVTAPVALAPQPGGGLLVAMLTHSALGSSVDLLRLDQTGQVDASFGSGGQVRVQNDERVGGADLAVRPDGRLVVAAVVHERAGPSYRLTLAAFDPHGRPDSSFGTDGSGVVSEPSGPALPSRIAFGPGGRLGVVGRSALSRGDLAAWSYEPDGTRSVSGRVRTPRVAEGGTALAFDRAGRMLLAGHVGAVAAPRGYAVARLRRSGGPDRGFGRRGLVRRRLRTPGGLEAIAVQRDGRVLVAGWQLRGRRVIRLMRLDG